MDKIEFTDSTKRGRHLLDLCIRSSRVDSPRPGKVASAEEGTFVKYEDLEHYGYRKSYPLDPTSLEPLQACLRDLGASPILESEGGDNKIVHHVHSQETIIDGISYPATQAYFSQIINPKAGVLIAHSNHAAPYLAILADPPLENYPLLHHWSDIAFLQLLCPDLGSDAGSPPALHHIIRYGIQNPDTVSIINTILSAHGAITLPTWPGLSFDADTREAQGILGTPNGKGIMWLLSQHRKSLGAKCVKKVTVFYAENKRDIFRWPSLVFWLDEMEG